MKTVRVRYSFVVEAKQIIGIPLYEDLPFTADLEFTLTPQGCPGPGAAVVVRVPIKVGQVQPNPNPPQPPFIPPLPLLPLPVDPTIVRDPYVAEVDSILLVDGGASVVVRIGNNGIVAARVRLEVALTLDDGTVAVGVEDDLTIPASTEFSVAVFVPLPSAPSGGGMWPPLTELVVEIVPYDPDDDPDNNRLVEPCGDRCVWDGRAVRRPEQGPSALGLAGGRGGNGWVD